MKRWIGILLVLALLSGCAGPREPQPAPPLTTGAPAAEAGYYAPGSQVQAQTGGAVFAYPLPQTDYVSAIPFGEDILLTRQSGELILLQGENGVPGIRVQTEVKLDAAAALTVSASNVGYYDQEARQVILLNGQLRELTRMQLPQDTQGSPVMDLTGKEVFYCLEQALWALDVQNGTVRLVLSHDYETVKLRSCFLQGSVLLLEVTGEGERPQYLYIDSDSGTILHKTATTHQLFHSTDRYLMGWQDGDVPQWVFGLEGIDPIALNVRGKVFSALAQLGAVGCTTNNGYAVLDYYDLHTGNRTAGVTIPDVSQVLWVDADSRYVWILAAHAGYSTLYRWDTVKSPIVDETVYTGQVYSAQQPDQEGLARCQAQAEELDRQYGVRVSIWEDAVKQTGTYQVTPEHQITVIEEMLEALELALSQYPAQVLGETIRGGKLHIGLVRSISEKETHAQFFAQGNAYILLSARADIPWDFAQALAGVVDAHVLGNSRDYDTWSQLNPNGFSYTLDQELPEAWDIYLEGDTRWFIHREAMTNAQADRASVFAYAMQSDTGAYFTSEMMQKKLCRLCEGIREAYDLESYDEVLPWEQYLTLEMDLD